MGVGEIFVQIVSYPFVYALRALGRMLKKLGKTVREKLGLAKWAPAPMGQIFANDSFRQGHFFQKKIEIFSSFFKIPLLLSE